MAVTLESSIYLDNKYNYNYLFYIYYIYISNYLYKIKCTHFIISIWKIGLITV